MVLTAFAIGIPFQTFVPMLARSFYALHDTRTPVIISLIGDSFVIIGDLILVKGLGFSSWALAISYSLGALIEAVILIFILRKRLNNFSIIKVIAPLWITIIGSIISGGVMFYLLKFFDKWDPIKILKPIAFENFVLDTRYTGNLIILTGIVAAIGMVVYIVEIGRASCRERV